MKLYEYINFGLSGAAGHMAQHMIPVYRLINSAKKSKALKAYDKSNLGAGGNVALTLLTPFGGEKAAVVGSKFQDLIDEKTKEYMDKYPDANKQDVRKRIKKALYKKAFVDLDQIHDKANARAEKLEDKREDREMKREIKRKIKREKELKKLKKLEEE